MGYALFTSVPTSQGVWKVVLLDRYSNCCDVLPCTCRTETEARAYAEAYLSLQLN